MMKPKSGGVVVLLLFKLIQLTINNIKLKPIMESKMKCKVVMLPTNKEAVKGQIYKENHFLSIHNNIDKQTSAYNPFKHKAQHIYLVSGEVIKAGDWVCNPKGTPNIQHHTNNVPQDNRNYGWNKIIATTDITLNLPLIPQSFIEKYVEVNGEIEEVMVELDIMTPSASARVMYSRARNLLKLRKDNTVIISKVKDTWNYDEHCTDMQYYMEYCQSNGYVTPQKWLTDYKHY